MARDDHLRPPHTDHPAAGSVALAGRLQQLLQQLAAPRSIQHAVVAVEKGDGTFRWSGAVGDAHPDGTPMRADTPIWIASVTKLHIASSILKLQERGLMRLDAPMSTYLPQSLIGGLHRLGGIDYTEQITVHRLLGHLTGLPDCRIAGLHRHPPQGREDPDRAACRAGLLVYHRGYA